MDEKEKMVRETEIALEEHEVSLKNAMNVLKAEKDRSCDRDCKMSKKVSPYFLPSPPLPFPFLSLHSP